MELCSNCGSVRGVPKYGFIIHNSLCMDCRILAESIACFIDSQINEVIYPDRNGDWIYNVDAECWQSEYSDEPLTPIKWASLDEISERYGFPSGIDYVDITIKEIWLPNLGQVDYRIMVPAVTPHLLSLSLPRDYRGGVRYQIAWSPTFHATSPKESRLARREVLMALSGRFPPKVIHQVLRTMV